MLIVGKLYAQMLVFTIIQIK